MYTQNRWEAKARSRLANASWDQPEPYKPAWGTALGLFLLGAMITLAFIA